MGLQYTGDLLAVTIDTVHPKPGDTWESFTSVNIVCMDGGRVVECKAGRDLPPADLARLRDLPSMTRVLLEVFVLKGNTYVTRVLDVDGQPAAKAS